MNINGMFQESLQLLFDGYCSSGGTGLFSLDKIAEKHGVNPHELGSALNSQGWIKNPSFEPTGFSCQISKSGIQHFQPGYFSGQLSSVIAAAGLINDWTGIMEALSLPAKDYQIAHDLGKVIESAGLAEVQFQQDDVYIKLSLFGMEQYQRENKGGFI